MKIVKRFGMLFVAVALVVVSAFSFVGCDSSNNEKSDLSFEGISTILTNFNEKLKPFLATLEFKYNNTDDESKVNLASNSISSLTKGMSESMKAFQSVFNQYIDSAGESVQITTSDKMVSIKTDRSEYVAKLNDFKTDLSIYTKDSSSESLYELRAKSDGGYLLQIVSKNTSDTTYTIYQLNFNGTNGKLAISEAEPSFTALFNAEVSEDAFPSVTALIFSN